MADVGHSTSGPTPTADGWLPRAEHIWVTNLSITYEKYPGILLAWRRNPGRPKEWQGWAVYARPGTGARGDGPYVSQSWLEASGIELRK